MRNPGERCHRLDVEVARVVQVLWQPEQVEIPCRITEEFRNDQAPRLAEPKELQPAELRFGRIVRRDDRLQVLAFDCRQPGMCICFHRSGLDPCMDPSGWGVLGGFGF